LFAILLVLLLLVLHFALGIYAVDKIGSSLATYGLAIMFPIFISDDFLLTRYGRKTTRDGTTVTEIDPKRQTELNAVRRYVRGSFIVGIMLWILTVALGAKASSETLYLALSLIFGAVGCLIGVGWYLWLNLGKQNST